QVAVSPAPFFEASAFITSNQFDALSNKLSNLTGIVGNIASLLPSLSPTENSAPTPPQLAGNGNPEALGDGGPIDQLDNVTINNATITNSNIPNGSGNDLLLSGGTLAGDLVIDDSLTTVGT